MATEVVFGNGNSLTTDDYEPAELAQALSKNSGKKKFAGDYLHVTTSDNESVWLNPLQVVYLRHASKETIGPA